MTKKGNFYSYQQSEPKLCKPVLLITKKPMLILDIENL